MMILQDSVVFQTRNSVNRILRGLREENVITMVNQKIVVLDKDYLKQFIQA